MVFSSDFLFRKIFDAQRFDAREMVRWWFVGKPFNSEAIERGLNIRTLFGRDEKIDEKLSQKMYYTLLMLTLAKQK